MRVVVGSDHAGYKLKQYLKDRLAAWGHEVEDIGTHTTDSCDYPVFGVAVGKRVVALGGEARGVAVCGSGIGISIAANRVAGVRAALVQEPTAAKLSRQHNDANVICFGERLIGQAVAEEALRVWLETPFEGGRHARRVALLEPSDAGERFSHAGGECSEPTSCAEPEPDGGATIEDDQR